MSLFHAVSAIRFKADQIVSGMAINLGALGLTSFLNFSVFGTNGSPGACRPPTPCTGDQVRTIPDWSIPGLHNIPGIGQIFFQQNPIFYLMLLTVLAAHFFLFNTTLGLRIRAVGEHPRAADTAGINVQSLRYLCVLISGLLSGLAGGFLALTLGSFSDNMTSGRGFIALAAMIFGKWTPFGAFGACILFGFGEALFDVLQSTPGPIQDYSLLLGAIPYVITIAALAGFIGRAIPPAADGIPYDPASGG
jgi:simple sugar transport system permease protein